MTTTTDVGRFCEYCGNAFHHGICPKVKAMEYFPDGTVKRVEFHGPVPTLATPWFIQGEDTVSVPSLFPQNGDDVEAFKTT